MKDLGTLVQLCSEFHLASNLEILVKTKDDILVTKLFSYMALWKVRMPKVFPEAFKSIQTSSGQQLYQLNLTL